MDSRTKRIIIRVTAIALQWVALTTALGSLVMRSEQSYAQILDPTFGAAPVFIGTFVAGFLLGLTVESPRFLAPLAILMCIVASMFIGLLTYAPVVDGILLRTADLDNFVSQRVIIMSLLMIMTVVPAAVGGNLLGGFLRVRQEIAPHPEDLQDDREASWWDRRDETDTNTNTGTGRRPV